MAEPALELIGTYVASGSPSSVSFTSIPADYKHLRLELWCSSLAARTWYVTLNNDTAYVYIFRSLLFSTSLSNSNSTGSNFGVYAHRSGGNGGTTIDIKNYADTVTYKNISARGGDYGGNGVHTEGMYDYNEGTITAVNRVDFSATTAINDGSTFALFGAKG